MKVLITGGAGFLGMNLARHLSIKPKLVLGPDRQVNIETIVLSDTVVPQVRPLDLDQRITFVVADISDREVVTQLVDCDDMMIFHLASVVSAGGEADFDLAMRVNLTGMINLLEIARARSGTQRLVFASSLAVFGGQGMPDTVTDMTKQTSQTTYGITKTIGELLINDYSRKGFLDGRSARLPNIIVRPGKPNAAASSFCSGLFREPLMGVACAVPVPHKTLIPLLGYRNCIQSLIYLAELDAALLGDDRAVSLCNKSYTVLQMIDSLKSVACQNDITLGEINLSLDPIISNIIQGWPNYIDASRAKKLGFPVDVSLEHVIQNFIDDFLLA
ncbi:MAG: NAD-dependent epimerase/dehydratase family protein [Paracoccaceae bacterium]|nr:NAD-dependent epimerase/dehydratase family protein [Paracoccaceae bacterium]